ncbi:MAG: glycosyltransferase family 39 protein [Deltaproteobacteria bacterium]|nr:glycosyltransferase family 39 protein [Deltaproteobacteria bacterium]
MNRSLLSYGKAALPLITACLAVFLLFPNEFRDLRKPDPPKSLAYQFPLQGSPPASEACQLFMRGFVQSIGGLMLDPGSEGSLMLWVRKEKGQGCLLRLWLYSDAERPGSLDISLDNGTTYIPVTKSTNSIGRVLDISPLATPLTQLVFRLTAKNHAPYAQIILDRLDIHIGAAGSPVPVLPDLTIPCAVFLIVYFIGCLLLHRRAGTQELLHRGLICCIIFTAFYLRWNEVIRLAGTALDSDAHGYLNFARRMDLFNATGFFSAQFGMREPMYLFIAKTILDLTGFTETHLRFVSCLFSVLVVMLSWRLGKKWLAEPIGILAAALLAVHPYLIELGARGLREEVFTCLLLVLLIIGRDSPKRSSLAKALSAGFTIGAILLTRSETLPLILAVMVCLMLFEKKTWAWRTVLPSLGIGVALLSPHLYNTWSQYGNPFYAVNTHTRFYANLEFAGRPGFPTQEELAVKGLYTGPTITPFEYYFKLHTPLALMTTSAIGLCKTTFAMPLSFASGKGNQKKILATLPCLKNAASLADWRDCFSWLEDLTLRDIGEYCLTACCALALVAGMLVLLAHRHFFICSCLVSFQLHTAFIAGAIGLEPRLTAHAYPVIALCCASAIYYGSIRLGKKIPFCGTNPHSMRARACPHL